MFFVTFLTKSLTEYDRQRLSMTLFCINVLQILSAITAFCLGAYVSLSLDSKAHLIKGYSLKPIGGSFSGSGIALFLLHCLGAKASNDCCYLRTRPRFQNKLFLFILGYVLLSAVLLSISVFCLVKYLTLKSALKHGLLHSMRLYPKDKNTKRDIDAIQMEYMCCGSSNYTDWFKFKWIPEKVLPSEEDERYSRKELLHSVPFSCCNPSIASPCFHQLVGVDRGDSRYPSDNFYIRGCTEVLLEVLEEVTLALTFLNFVPFLMEATIAVQTRYLQTAIHDCNNYRNPKGISNCWLFKRHSYEPDLQLNEMCKGNLFSSSEEDPVIYEPMKIMYQRNAGVKLKRLPKSKERNTVKKHVKNEKAASRRQMLSSSSEESVILHQTRKCIKKKVYSIKNNAKVINKKKHFENFRVSQS